MTDTKENVKEEAKATEAPVVKDAKVEPAKAEAKSDAKSEIKTDVKDAPKKPEFKKKNFGGKSWGNKGGKKRDNREADKEFDQSIVDIARVTRVMAGGKRMRFRACVVIGDRKGRVAFAVAKGADVTLAVNKAVNKAKKELYTVPMINETIPHAVTVKSGAAKLMIKPAPKGTGIIAGGAVRIVFDLAGISNVVAKILGTNNKINNVTAAIKALKMLKKVEPKSSSKDKTKKVNSENK